MQHDIGEQFKGEHKSYSNTHRRYYRKEYRVVQLVCVAKRIEHASTLFKQLCILKVVDLVKFKNVAFISKTYRNELPDSLQQMFKHYTSTHGNRKILSAAFVFV